MKATHGHTGKHAGSGKHLGTGKHRPMTAAREAAVKKWQLAGAHAHHHVHAVGKHPEHGKASKWSPICDVACCAAEALAASLRLAGHGVSDTDVLGLYWRTAEHPDAGATLEATIAAAAEYGLGGARLLDARPAEQLRDGVVLGLDLAERHALAVDGHGVWTWGEWLPASCALLGAADEAWELTWQC